MSWSHAFGDPIITSDGTELVTLRDAIAWLAKKVPKSRHNDEDVQLAARLLTDAAENGGILMMAEIATRRVVGQRRPAPPAGPRRKAAKKFKVNR